MEKRVESVAPPMEEVRMVEPEVVRQLRVLAAQGWGTRRISRELGIARNTVKRYVRGGSGAEQQERLEARCLDEKGERRAIELFDGAAERNAVVVATMLREEGIEASVRTVQRVVEDRRREVRAAQVATVRYETAPGHQMQIDFGQKWVPVAGEMVRVFLLVAVLSYSRRLYVHAFLSEQQDDWREGIAAAFHHFGGVPATLLGDNARALVEGRDRQTGVVTFHPGYLAFCRDWDVQPRACAPYRARTKGKTESGVKYVKRNGLAGRSFDSFAQLQGHLARWMVEADAREHGTTHEKPIERFEREEREALRALPARAMPARQRSLKRRVAHDALVDVYTIRYSVPHRLVRSWVEVRVGEQQVQVFAGADCVAVHRRAFEPHTSVIDAAHYEGLWRPSGDASGPASPSARSMLGELGRSLDEYAAAIGGEQ